MSKHVEAFYPGESVELAADAESELIWKESLIEGEFTHPQKRDRKFRVIPEGKSDPAEGIISMSELIEAHDAGAYDQVQVPLAEKKGADHDDYARVNTGYVKKLRVRQREDGKHVLDSGIHFTEPDVKGKVERGSINNCSSGIFFGVEKGDGRKFPVAMRHLALTNTNWIPGLTPFVNLSDDETAEDVEVIELADTVWSPKDSLDQLRQWVSASISGLNAGPLGMPSPDQPFFFLRDLASNKALVDQESKDGVKTFVVPFKKKKDGVEIAPQDDWQVAQQEWVAASEDTLFQQIRKDAIEASSESADETSVETSDEEKPADETTEETSVQTSEEDEPKGESNSKAVAEAVAAFSAERYEKRPDTPEGRLRAAQEGRKALLASTTSNRGGVRMADKANLDQLNLSDEDKSAVEAILASEREEREALQSERDQLRQQHRQQEVDAEIERCKSLGLSENSGFLKLYRRVLLADDGEPAAVLMSEDGSGKQESVTITDTAKSLIDALPKNDDGKLALSEQHLRVEEGEKPKNDTADELPLDEEVSDLAARLKIDMPQGA